MSSKKTASIKLPSKKKDLDPILAPLEGKEPGGVFLAYDAVYNKIRAARQEDDPSLPQGVWKKSLKVSDFKEVEKLTTEALTTQSKDFQLMAWLIEAWFKLYQLQGLIRGLKLLNDLCLAFWETGYPPLKRGDNEYRLAPFHWLNEKLSARIPEIFITEKSLSQQTCYRFIDWKEALSLEKIFQKSDTSAEAEKAQADGRPTLKTLQKAISETSSCFYKTLALDLEAAFYEVEVLEKFLLTHYKSSEISLHQFRRGLNDIRDLIHQIDAERKENTSQNKSEEVSPPSDTLEENLQREETPPEPLSPSQGEETILSEKKHVLPKTKKTVISLTSLNSREEAYEILQHIQGYLMETEPHSPAPYLIKRALKWEHMTLEEVFQEVLTQTGDLNQLLTLLGIQKPPISSDS